MSISSMQRSRRVLNSSLLFLIIALVASIVAVPAAAQQQNEIVLSVDFDGTASFGDPLDDGSGNGVHTPGEDGGPNNNVVRTNDQVQYRIDWNVNEVDGTGVTLKMSLPEGMTWLADPSTTTGLPAGCVSGTNTANGGRDLECVTEDEFQGSNGAIHPRALVGAFFDGDSLAPVASIESDQSGPVVSDPVPLTVSARPKGDWIKGKVKKDAVSGSVIGYEPDEEIFGIDNGGVNGRIFVWNLRLVPAGGLKGAEPMDDSIDINFFDQMWFSTPDAVLATGLMPNGRTACGGYDGSGSYPFGSAGLGTADQTTAGTWTCTDQTATAGYGYPIVEIDITGHDTSTPPPKNADNSGNSSTLISGQIAMWMSEEALGDMPTPQIIANAITGSDDEIVNTNTDIVPIQVYGTSGAVDEADYGLNNASPYEFPKGPPPASVGRSFRHYIRYQNGPLAEIEGYDPNTDLIYRGMDRRRQAYGGPGYSITDGANGTDGGQYWRWDGDGQTPRGNELVVVADFLTVTNPSARAGDFEMAIHGCVSFDPTHQELIPFAPSHGVSVVDTHATRPELVFDLPTIGGGTSAPSTATNLVHVIAGTGSVGSSVYWPRYTQAYVTNRGEIPHVVEVAAGAVTPGIAVAEHGATCNGGDADARGWVNADDPAALAAANFDPNGDGRYEDITHVRVRLTEPQPWHSTAGYIKNDVRFGVGFQINLNMRVKDNPAAGFQEADQELFVYASRALGDWDGTGNAPLENCTNNNAFPTDVTTSGWCNLPFSDDGSSSTDISDFKNDFDSNTVEFLDTLARVRSAHADAIYIVEPALAIGKKNLAGAADIVINGDIVEFEINPKVVGSSLDSINDVKITDPLSANYEFVAFTQLPTTPGATCAYTTVITCSFGDHIGGWSDTVRYTVKVVNAGANATLKNTVTITGNDPILGTPKAPAKSSANAFTPAPFEESGIVKVLGNHIGPCLAHPTEDPPPADWGTDCELIAQNSGMLFDLTVVNEGNVDLENYRIIDVLPHLNDSTEPSSMTLTGDGRTPPSAFTGSLTFNSITGQGGETFWYTADPAGTVSRDPGVSELTNTWCTAPAGGVPVTGLGACPASAADVTAVYANLGTLPFGATHSVRLALETDGNNCDDIYTNTFGGRTDNLKLPVRSNDVSLMVGFCDAAIDIEKATNGQDADTPNGPILAEGEAVTWTYEVENAGSTALIDATVTDDQGVTVDCDVDGNGSLDGTNVIPLMLPGDKITCEGTGTAVAAGQYTNNATVEGQGAVPDPATCGCDTSDPSTWPTDASGFIAPTDPITGEPLFPVDAEDPSNYWGYEPNPAIGVQKDTNGADADTQPGPGIAPGDPVTWTYVVSNTGNVALRDAAVTDDQGVTVICDIDGNGLFDDGTNIIPFFLPVQSVTCQGTGIATAGQYTNNASVSGTALKPPAGCACDLGDPSTWPEDPSAYVDLADPDGVTPWVVDAEDPSHYFGADPSIDIEKDTNGVDADTPSGPNVPVGDPVTWTYVVTNDGSTALTDATVTDDQGVTVDCDVDGDGVLDGTNVIPIMVPNAEVTCEGTGISTGGQYTNNATVSGQPALPNPATCGCDLTDPSGWPDDDASLYSDLLDGDGEPFAPVDAEDPSHYFGVEPSIDIEKDTNGVDADTPVGPYVAAGDPVTWTYVVTNDGNTALTDATVTDDQGVTVDCDVDGDGVLDGTNVIPIMVPDAEVTCEGTGISTGGQYTNNATVSGQPALPDFDTCGCDITDPSGWPTNAADYSDATDADGAPLDPVDAEDPSHYFGVDPSVDIEKATNGADADTPTGKRVPVGDPITWTYVVTNDGNTALGDVTVTDDQGVTVDCDVDGDGVFDGTNVILVMLPDAEVTCEGTGIATAGQYTNNASVSGDPLLPDPDSCECDLQDPLTWPEDTSGFVAPADADGEPIPSPSDDDDSHYFGTEPSVGIEKATNGVDADTVTGPQIPVGDPVTWTYVVTNDGNTSLLDATVTDDQGVTVDCDVDGDGVLDGTNIIPLMLPDAEVTCEGTGISTGGQYTNNASVSGTPALPDPATCGCDLFDPATWPEDPTLHKGVVDAFGDPVDPVTAEDPSHYFGTDPSIDIEKSTNGEDADTPRGPEVPVGDPVTWTYVVTNDGNTALANATVSDDQGVTVDCDVDGDGVLDGTNIIPFLLPDAEVTCEGTGVAVAGQYTNNASVSGTPQLPDPDTCGCDLFDPATWPEDPTLFGDVVDADGNAVLPVEDDDPSHYYGSGPGADIEKATNGVDADTVTGPQIPVGDTVTWTYVVTNTGNTALANATVSDDQGVTVDCDVDGDGVLDGTNIIPLIQPLGSVTCEGTGVSTGGQYTNTAALTGAPVLPDPDTCGCDLFDPSTWPEDPTLFTPALDGDGEPLGPLTDEDPSHYFGTDPSVDVEKSTNGVDADTPRGPEVPVGSPVTWTYVVTNDGNVPLANATVTDDQGVAVDCDVDGDGVLDGTNVIPFLMPAGSVTCEGSGVAVSGQYTNNATVSGAPQLPDPDTCGCDLFDPSTWPADPTQYTDVVDADGNPVAPAADEDPSHYYGTGPGIDIEKSTNGVDSDEAPGEDITVGEDVTWTYVVTNTGNTPIANATVSDDQGVVVVCDVNGDGVFDDATNVIALMLPADEVTCQGTGVATEGPYENNGSVAGDLVLPDPATCGCDLSDPATWPSDPALYTPVLGLDGQPVPGVGDEDPSHYTGTIQTISGTVWSDTNNDGKLDPNEPVYAGVVVTLLDANGDPVLDDDGNPITTVTDANGDYSFDVPPGDYRLRFTPPAGTRLTIAGGDNDADGSFTTGVISVAAGQEVPNIDAGFVNVPTVAVTNNDRPTAPLAFSGSTTANTVLPALLLLLIGGLLVSISRRRRQS